MTLVIAGFALAAGVLIGMVIQTRVDMRDLRRFERRRNPPLRGGLR